MPGDPHFRRIGDEVLDRILNVEIGTGSTCLGEMSDEFRQLHFIRAVRCSHLWIGTKVIEKEDRILSPFFPPPLD